MMALVCPAMTTRWAAIECAKKTSNEKGETLLIYMCDLFGVAVFAMSGALAARQLRMDPFGAIILGSVTAVGGGTLRDLLLGYSVFWIAENSYIYVIMISALLTMIWPLKRGWPYRIMTLADAFGLALFTVLGMERALQAEVSPLIAVIMGVMTGVAGGIIRDLLSGQIPLILRREIYATASLAGALTFIGYYTYRCPTHGAC